MMKTPVIEWISLLVLSAAWACAQSQAAPSPLPAAPAPRRVRVATDAASALVVQKAPLTYPEAARKAGVQGTVVLNIVTSYSGDVKEITVVYGDPALAQAATDAVKQWKYQPYLVEGSPVEMETQVNVNFQIKAPAQPAQPAPPPLGTFRDNAYSNDYFGIYYPVSRDWVRETDLMRKKMAAEGKAQGTYVLLAAVRIPADKDPLRADSTFTVLAVNRSGAQDCTQYLDLLTGNVQAHKEGKRTGQVSQFTIAGHDFYRVDFEFREGIDHRTFVCTSVKDYLLHWNIGGWSKSAIETAVSTLKSITAAPPAAAPVPPAAVPAPPSLENGPNSPKKVQISPGVSTGLLIRKVQPVYPQEAKYARIQGTVLLSAVINKNGDVVDLEVLDGPIELVVSAVNAVRKWKYRPYLLMGEPVEVQTQIMVIYTLSRH